MTKCWKKSNFSQKVQLFPPKWQLFPPPLPLNCCIISTSELTGFLLGVMGWKPLDFPGLWKEIEPIWPKISNAPLATCMKNFHQIHSFDATKIVNPTFWGSTKFLIFWHHLDYFCTSGARSARVFYISEFPGRLVWLIF
jgi:hypothetical protein